ncbi:hypothetical protein NMG60_11012183 [Bertholletia excelsa]
MPQHSSSAEKVFGNDDLLTKILACLPLKPLFQFKSVSKRWLSLIIDPHLARCRNPDPSLVSGLFLLSSMRRCNSKLNFIPLRNHENPLDDAHLGGLTSIPGLSSMRILNSCHGLLCCCSYSKADPGNFKYHVLNPATKQFISLPEPHTCLKGLNLAFDPARSPHYKVVCIWSAVSVVPTEPRYHQIEIYSSETGSWRASGEPFEADQSTQFLGGVYWNGAINWFSTMGNSLYFKVEEEHLGTMPMPPILEEDWTGRKFRYYGESRGHLHLVEMYDPVIQIKVYEMERNYSGWFVKYHIDVGAVGDAFPEMMRELSWHPISLAILSIVRGEKEDDSFLVLHIPGKIIRFHLADKTFEMICDVAPEHCDGDGMIEDSLRYFWLHAFQYIESLSCV